MRFPLIVITCALLSGCVSIEVKKDIAAAQAICEGAITPELRAQLAGKIPLVNLNEITGPMLSNPDKPTPSEAVAIVAMNDAKGPCRSALMAVAQKYEPATLPAFQEENYKTQLVIGELAAGHLTYGNANRLTYEAFLEAQKQYTSMHQQEIAQAQIEEANRLAALAVTSSIIRNMQPQQPQATQTVCVWQGAFINCNSR